MKKTLHKYILPLLASFSVLFASCGDISERDDEVNTNNNTPTVISLEGTDLDSDLAYITIGLKDASAARAAFPVLDTSSSGLDKYSWTLEGKVLNTDNTAGKTDEEGTELTYTNTWDTYSGMTVSPIGLKVLSNGSAYQETTWTFTLTARIAPNSDSSSTSYGAVYTGTQTVTLTSGLYASPINFEMSMTSIDTSVTGNGSLEITLNYTPSNVKHVVAALYKETSETSDDTTTYSISKTAVENSQIIKENTSSGQTYSWADVASGVYVVRFTFYDGVASSDSDTLGNCLGSWDEYANIVAQSKSTSTVQVDSLDDVYSITYEPATYMSAVMGSNGYRKSFSRHSGTFVLPKASEMSSEFVTFGGWFTDESYDYEKVVTQINTSERTNRKNITLYGRFIDSKEAGTVSAPTLTYGTNNSSKATKHVGNKVTASVENFSGSLSYKWYTSTSNTFSAEFATAIADATSSKYKITSNEVGKYVFASVTPKYKLTAKTVAKGDVSSGEAIAYYEIADGEEKFSAGQTETTDLIGKSIVTLSDSLTVQYSGKVLVNNKPLKSKLILSGILADEYGNAVTTYEGDLESYDPLASSKKLNVTISAAGYDINTEGNTTGSKTVYIPVQSTPLSTSDITLGSSTNATNANDETQGWSTLVNGLIMVSSKLGDNWQYAITAEDDEPTTWKAFPSDGILPEVNDTTTVIEASNILWTRVAESGEAGEEGYIYPSEAVAVTIESLNIKGDSSTTDTTAMLLSGPEINAIFTSNFASATSFMFTTESAPTSAVTISTSASGVPVKAWVKSKVLYVAASGYDGTYTISDDTVTDKRLKLPADSSSLFAGLTKLKTVDLSKFDTSEVTNMSKFFQSCSALTSVTFGENFNTAAVTDMSYMFDRTALTSVDLSKFTTDAVTTMEGMFANSSFTSLDLSGFATSNVTNMASMFSGADALGELVLTGFNTEKVTDMSSMFAGTALEEVDVSMFSTANVTDMTSMFANMESLIYIDVSSFTVGANTAIDSMFSGDSELQKIYTASGADWSGAKSGKGVFTDCESLVGGSGNSWSSSATSKAYAKVDGGYFTEKTGN